ncbi:MAG: hypothetical protein IPJ04_17400 [Candidatus Eisenbacteria bacterium]|nr:hypothetical protein [Candidatus Eisenbacteria bacterium]
MNRHSIVRTPRLSSMLLSALTATSLLLGAHGDAAAQDSARPGTKWDFVTSSGALLPTGEQRDAIASGALSTAQLSYEVRPAIAAIATIGWARSRDLVSAGEPKLDLFSYDLGAEARLKPWRAGRLDVRPFVGAGAGARTYNHRHADLAVTHDVTGYAGVGAELGAGWVRMRLEARDYVLGFQPLGGDGPSDTRSEVALMAGLRLGAR